MKLYYELVCQQLNCPRQSEIMWFAECFLLADDALRAGWSWSRVSNGHRYWLDFYCPSCTRIKQLKIVKDELREGGYRKKHAKDND